MDDTQQPPCKGKTQGHHFETVVVDADALGGKTKIWECKHCKVQHCMFTFGPEGFDA